MTEPTDDAAGAGPAGADPGPDRTRRMSLPPVPGRKGRKAVGRADQPTDQLPPPPPRPVTDPYGSWQPLQPRVVPRRRSPMPWVIAALVVLVLVVGVVVVLVYG